jgi:hypothetical protein
MRFHDVGKKYFCKIVSRALIWSEEDKPSGSDRSTKAIRQKYTYTAAWIHISLNESELVLSVCASSVNFKMYTAMKCVPAVA